MIGYIVQNYYPFKKNRSDEEKKTIGLAMSLLSSSVADFDVITDWIYFTEIATRSDDFIIPTWVLTLQLISCICGSIAWACIASDGWVFDLLRRGCKWIILGPLYILSFIFYEIPRILLKCCGYDLTFTWYGDLFLFGKLEYLIETINKRFDRGMRVSSGMLLFMGILVEDVPQLIVTSLVEGIYGPDGGFSNSAKLNLILSVLDILHKLAQAYDERHLLFKSGDKTDMTLWHQDWVMSLAEAESNQLLSASMDATTKLWDLTTGKLVRNFKALSLHYGVRMLSNDRFVIVAQNGLAIFNKNSSDVEKEVKTDKFVKCVAVSKEDDYLLAGTGSAIIKYNSNSFEETQRFVDMGADSLAMLDSERFVSGMRMSSNKCFLWNMSDNTSQEIKLADTFNCVCIVTSTSFLIGSVKGSQLWDTNNLEQCTKTFDSDSIWSIFIVNDALFVSAGDYPYVAKLWNIETAECLATFKGHTNSIFDVVYLPQRKAIATSSKDKSIKVWPIGQYLEEVDNFTDNDDNNA